MKTNNKQFEVYIFYNISGAHNPYGLWAPEYIDLAKAKSEALGNIESLFKQNIKSCNAKRQRQRER